MHINKSLYFLQVEVFILPFCSMSINVPLPLRYGTPAPPTSVRKPSRVTMASYWHCVSRGNKMHTCTNNTFCDHNVHLKLGMTGLPPDHDSISFFFCFHRNKLYSGSADCTIIVSDIHLPASSFKGKLAQL